MQVTRLRNVGTPQNTGNTLRDRRHNESIREGLGQEVDVVQLSSNGVSLRPHHADGQSAAAKYLTIPTTIWHATAWLTEQEVAWQHTEGLRRDGNVDHNLKHTCTKSNWMEMCCRMAAGAHKIVVVVIVWWWWWWWWWWYIYIYIYIYIYMLLNYP